MSTEMGNWKTAVLRYLAWLVASALALLDIIMFREAFHSVLVWYGLQRQDALRAQGAPITIVGGMINGIDRAMILLLGVIGVIFVVLVEYRFRKAEKEGHLLRTIGTVFGVQVAIALISFLIFNVI